MLFQVHGASSYCLSWRDPSIWVYFHWNVSVCSKRYIHSKCEWCKLRDHGYIQCKCFKGHKLELGKAKQIKQETQILNVQNVQPFRQILLSKAWTTRRCDELKVVKPLNQQVAVKIIFISHIWRERTSTQVFVAFAICVYIFALFLFALVFQVLHFHVILGLQNLLCIWFYDAGPGHPLYRDGLCHHRLHVLPS